MCLRLLSLPSNLSSAVFFSFRNLVSLLLTPHLILLWQVASFGLSLPLSLTDGLCSSHHLSSSDTDMMKSWLNISCMYPSWHLSFVLKPYFNSPKLQENGSSFDLLQVKLELLFLSGLLAAESHSALPISLASCHDFQPISFDTFSSYLPKRTA